MEKFDPIEYLSGLTTYVFDKSLLKRIAHENVLYDIDSYEEVSEEQADRCKVALYEAIYFSPYSTGGFTQKHGDFSVQVGQQVVTSATRDLIGEELRRLYKKLGETDKEETLDASGASLGWINDECY